ncbi:hypothetical protein [Sphingomonas yabuuchiae]|uniref:hypothetical protein n=1 Tax=Sphingomonas yabuuchiae TaxID=172044 RepID=UPI0025F601BB|nr:hypothetical protein [uncultured Sphingomonas sp.]
MRPLLIVMTYGMTNDICPGAPRSDPRTNATVLIAAGIRNAFYISTDTGQEFQTWRRNPQAMAPWLFRE